MKCRNVDEMLKSTISIVTISRARHLLGCIIITLYSLLNCVLPNSIKVYNQFVSVHYLSWVYRLTRPPSRSNLTQQSRPKSSCIPTSEGPSTVSVSFPGPLLLVEPFFSLVLTLSMIHSSLSLQFWSSERIVKI